MYDTNAGVIGEIGTERRMKRKNEKGEVERKSETEKEQRERER